MSTTFLIRHGESEANQLRHREKEANTGLLTNDHKDAGLTQTGHEQAKHVAQYLKSYPLDLIITSPYLRAKQTAKSTKSFFPSITLMQWEVVQEFTYLTTIDQEQLTIKDQQILMDAYWEQCLATYVDGPGSESFEAFIGRACTFLIQLEMQQQSAENIAVFSHEQFIVAILWLMERRPPVINGQAMQSFKDYFKKNRISNGTIVQMQLQPWHPKRITEHLPKHHENTINMLGNATRIGKHFICL